MRYSNGKCAVVSLAGDDSDLLFVLSHGLRSRGYETIVAPPAEVITRLGEGGGTDLVIIDDAGSDRGLPVLPIAARPGDGPPVPYVLLTPQDMDSVVGAGSDWAAVVAKPFLLADLVRAIEALGVSGGGETLCGTKQPGQPDGR